MFLSLDEAERENVLLEVRKLPQVKSGAISKEQIRKWLDQVARIDPGRLAWHVRRLGGIGGSEIASVMGLKGAYTTPEIIAKQKLMLIPPFRASSAMRRGAVAEDFIRDLFETSGVTSTELEMSENVRSNALSKVIETFFMSEMDRRFGVGTWRPRPDLEALIQRPREQGVLPAWAIASPDRIYEISIEGRPCIVPVDFKAPSEATMKEIRRDSSKLNPWRAQVQHIGAILADCGYPPSGLVLAVFDYANVGTSTFLIDETVLAPDVCDLIVSSGNRFWNEHILAGVVPAVQTPATEPPPPEVEVAAKRSAYAAAMRDAARDELEELQAPIRDWIMRAPVARAGFTVGDIDGAGVWSPRIKQAFDAEAAIFRLLDTGHITPQGSLSLRGPAEPMPASDPRFASAIAVARDKLSALLQLAGQWVPGEALPIDQLEEIRCLLGEAASLVRPMRPGPARPEMVKRALADAGEPLSPYMSTEITLARSSTKAGTALFKQITGDAREIVIAHAVRSVPVEPNVPQPEGEPRRAAPFPDVAAVGTISC